MAERKIWFLNYSKKSRIANNLQEKLNFLKVYFHCVWLSPLKNEPRCVWVEKEMKGGYAVAMYQTKCLYLQTTLHNPLLLNGGISRLWLQEIMIWKENTLAFITVSNTMFGSWEGINFFSLNSSVISSSIGEGRTTWGTNPCSGRDQDHIRQHSRYSWCAH